MFRVAISFAFLTAVECCAVGAFLEDLSTASPKNTVNAVVRAHTGENRLTLYAVKLGWDGSVLVPKKVRTHDGQGSWVTYGGKISEDRNSSVIAMAYHGDSGCALPLVDVAFEVRDDALPGYHERAVTLETLSMVNAGTRNFSPREMKRDSRGLLVEEEL